jgi:ribose 5-phosphate isomerase A
VDADLNCIKGGGACHLREKVLAEAAMTWIVVADYRKNSLVLGINVRSCLRYAAIAAQALFRETRTKLWRQYKKGVPVEVAPFAYAKLLANLRAIGSPDAALRMATHKAGPIVTDNGNFVIDAPFPEKYMQDPLTVRRLRGCRRTDVLTRGTAPDTY